MGSQGRFGEENKGQELGEADARWRLYEVSPKNTGGQIGLSARGWPPVAWPRGASSRGVLGPGG